MFFNVETIFKMHSGGGSIEHSSFLSHHIARSAKIKKREDVISLRGGEGLMMTMV